MNFKSKKIKKALFLIFFGVVLFWGLNNIGFLFDLLGGLITMISPFLLGIAIAFIFNGPMLAVENVLYHEKVR